MGERKVLNKYYPPDFDPTKIPRRIRPKNLQSTVRSMIPMTIQCNTCGNYMYKGTKLNFRKEDVQGEKYLEIQIIRLYFKCTKCSAELIMKTDPQNSDYIMEVGASRNYEPWRAEDEATNMIVKKREREELGDAMKALENRTLDSKREMDIMVSLDELKSMRSRHANVGIGDMMEALYCTTAKENFKKFMQSIDDAKVEKFYLDQKSLHHSETLEDRNFLKRRKIEGGPLITDHGVGQVQADGVYANKMAEPIAKGSNSSAEAPSFAVRMKPMVFNIKPKKGSIPTSTKHLTQNALDDESTIVPKDLIRVDDPQSNSIVTSLGLVYSSDDDFE